MPKVDLNCDMGEGFGVYQIGRDAEILDYVTSANIACGFHAGDPGVMRKTVAMAVEKGVAIGAHPGLPDLKGFGRREMRITPQEAYDIVLYQIGALEAFVKARGAHMQHVKPHGALYNMAAKSKPLSEAVAKAVKDVSGDLILFGLAGSELIQAGEKYGLKTANEVFSDRTYQQDGTLTSRQEPDALITNQKTAVKQVIRMIKEKRVRTLQDTDLSIQAETICIHGDGDHAVDFASYMTRAFQDADIQLAKAAHFL